MTNNYTLERTDFAVVCALEVEREAVCRAFQLKDRDRELRGQRRYWRGPLRVGSRTFGVVVTQLPEMANVHAAIRTSMVLRHWNPQALLLVGIAAAALESQRLGDVIVGRSVYYYELSKVSRDGRLPQPDMIHADPVLYDAAVTARKWPGLVRVPRPDGAGIRPERSFGDIASGEKVIGDPRFRSEVTNPNRKIRALEMEGYGFSVAALQAGENIRHLVIRGLCDYADQIKGDEWHAYASASAAAYARHLLKEWPFPPLDNGAPRQPSSVPINRSERGATNIIALPPDARTTRELKLQGRTIFISYSRRDRRWVDHLLTHLKPLQRENLLDIWDDSRIKPGAKWREEIESALNKAAVAILMISPNFLASDFVMNDEVPALLRQAESRGTVIIPLIVAPSLFGQSILNSFQAINTPETPLSKLNSFKRDEVLVKVATSINELFS
jgi:nucleoside phosphorylase